MRPITHRNPYEAPQTPAGVATEPRAVKWIGAWQQRGIMVGLFAMFVLVQFLPGAGKSSFFGEMPIWLVNVASICAPSIPWEKFYIDFSNGKGLGWFLKDFLEATPQNLFAISLASYLVLNLFLLTKRVAFRKLIMCLLLLANLNWLIFNIQGPIELSVVMVVQPILITITTVLFSLRLYHERSPQSS